MTDTLESECREWLEEQYLHELEWDEQDMSKLSASLASFVREQVLAERRRCVDVVAKDVMQREGRNWKRWSDSTDPAVLTATDYYSTLLGLKEGTQ